MVKFDFPKGEASSIHLVIYVPSTININHLISNKQFKKRIRDTINFLRKKIGGSTTLSGIGNYRSGDLRKSVTERVAKIEAFATVSDYDKVDTKIRDFLIKKKQEWKQESLSYEFEESLYFV